MAGVFAMECHYPGEVALFADKAFLLWVAELEKEMVAFSRDSGYLPYDLPLAKSTGLTCWHQSYEDGMTPEEAFASDLENGQY